MKMEPGKEKRNRLGRSLPLSKLTPTVLALAVGLTAMFATTNATVGATSLSGEVYAASPSHYGLPDIADLVQQQKAKVVSVKTEIAATPMSDGPMDPFFGFGFKFGGHGPMVGQGSGFIVDPAGYILTNNHVVKGATSITVQLSNGHTYKAKLVGKDPKTDLALIKINAGHKLPAVQLGDSHKARVGEWVVAIGNPFGLRYSVTVGVLSAKGRNIGEGPYDNFLQTDASINPGNSGGPLFNLKGQVIGINSAIIRNGQGIGFAVPINMAKAILPQLRSRGYVVRGYIGAGIQDMNEELANSFGVSANDGVLVGSVQSGGPADKSGIEPGDIITRFHGHRMHSMHQLLIAVANTKPGTTVTAQILRNGKRKTVRLHVAQRPGSNVASAHHRHGRHAPSSARLGVAVRSLGPNAARQLGVKGGHGVLVERVLPNTPASRVLEPGDVILQVGRTPVSTPRQLSRALKTIGKGQPLRMLISRHGNTLFVAVRLR